MKTKWLEHLNSSWVEETSTDIVTRQGVSTLFEKLITNHEVESTPLSKVSTLIVRNTYLAASLMYKIR